jgi:hypothetical protein
MILAFASFFFAPTFVLPIFLAAATLEFTLMAAIVLRQR